MLKIELISLFKNSKDIIDFLQRRGAVEISSHEEPENMTHIDTEINISQLEKMRTKAEKAREVLGFPEDYYMPCFIGIGRPQKNAPVPIQKDIDIKTRIHWDKY